MKMCPISSGAVVTCVEGGANCVCEGEGTERQCFCNRGFNTTSTDPGICVGKWTFAYKLTTTVEPVCSGHIYSRQPNVAIIER